VAETEGTVGGFALWFLNFSTWRGTHGIYLEDLFVRAELRGSGLGKALLAALAAECVEQGYQRLEWAVLNWNPAVGFYRALGALPQDEWTTYRLTDEPLHALAAEA
jgi:GNAT superfamily N-acetyltransferase